MKHMSAAAAAALAFACTGAGATASIAGTIGDMPYTFDFSGYGSSDGVFGGWLFTPTDTYSRTFSYDLTLHNDGETLAQPRTWSTCAPIGDFTVASPTTYCGPAFTGKEQVEFDFATVRSASANPDFLFTVTGAPASVNVGAGQTVHLSGEFTVTESWIGAGDPDIPAWNDYLWIASSAWVDSNKPAPLFAVPEPADASLWLSGLVLVAATARARRRRAA